MHNMHIMHILHIMNIMYIMHVMHRRQSTRRDPLLSGHVEKNLVPYLHPLTPPNWVPKFPYAQELSNGVCDEGVNQHCCRFLGQIFAEKVAKSPVLA